MSGYSGLGDLGGFDGGYDPIKKPKPPGPADITQPLAPVPGGLKVPGTVIAPAPNGLPGQSGPISTGSAAGKIGLPVNTAPAPGVAPAVAGAPLPSVIGQPVRSAAPARPAGTSGQAPDFNAFMKEYMDLVRQQQAAMQARIDQNAKLRDQTLASLGGMQNPWDVKNNADARLGLARSQHGDAYDAFTAFNGTTGNILDAAAASGRIGGAVDKSIGHAGENYGAAVKQAYLRRDDDWRQRAQGFDQWKIGLQNQVANADLAGDQIGLLSTMATQGLQGAGQGMLVPGQIAQQSAGVDSIRADIAALAERNRLTRAQADQAEQIAQNQGMIALLNFLGNIAGGAGRIAGGL